MKSDIVPWLGGKKLLREQGKEVQGFGGQSLMVAWFREDTRFLLAPHIFDIYSSSVSGFKYLTGMAISISDMVHFM